MSDENQERSSVTVRIAGEEHTIRANAEAEYTRSCARFVDDRIGEIRSKAGPLETRKAAILAALSITDEFFQAREALEQARKEVASRATNLGRRLDAALAGAEGGPEPGETEPS